MKNDRRDVRVDLDVADTQDDDRVIPGWYELLDRAFQPNAGALDEDRTAAIGHRLQTGEPIACLGG